LSDLIGYMKFLFLIFLSLEHHFWPGLGNNASSYELGYLLSNTLIDKISTKCQSRMRGSLPPSLTHQVWFYQLWISGQNRVHENIYIYTTKMSAYAFGISSNLCTQLPFQECLEAVAKVAQRFHLNLKLDIL